MKPAEEYTVGMILRLIEGNLVPVKCMENEPNCCPRYEKCATIGVWERINDAVNGVVDSITLAELETIRIALSSVKSRNTIFGGSMEFIDSW